MSAPTWDEFERKRPADGSKESDEAKRFAELCAAVFTSGSGQELMALIRARTIDHRSPPSAPEAVLREDEAVRGFVALLERNIARGLESLAKAKSKPT